MGLRTRLWAGMVVCAVVPLAGAGWIARREVGRWFVTEDARRKEAAVRRVEQALDARSASLQRGLSRFCAHDYLVDRTLLQLATGQFNEGARGELGAVLPEVRTALGLDTLSLVEDDGTVLASAHYAGRAGSEDRETYTVASHPPGRAWVRSVRVREGEGPRDRLVLESACVRRRGNVAVAVAGGVALDAQRFEENAQEEGVRVTLVTGEPVGASTARRRAIPLRGMDGRPVASVQLETDDKALRAFVTTLDALLAAAAVVAAGVAAVVAAALATTLTRPIRRVAEAADRIAAGDRSVQLDERAGAEVGRMVAAFNQMSSSLASAEKRVRRAERMAAWRDIARQMAHEIKNPLTPIRMGVERLRKARARNLDDFGERFEEETTIVLEEVGRLQRLVEDFSRFARMPRPKLGAVKVSELVEHVIEMNTQEGVALVARGEGVELASLPPLRADRDQLTQVLLNLVANACWASSARAQEDPSRGAARVEVTVRVPEAAMVEVTVKDNGAGIDPEVMARLFEPYVTRRPGGTGLGLAIAHRIAVEHGGTLSGTSTTEGATFVLRLPFAGPRALSAESELGEVG